MRTRSPIAAVLSRRGLENAATDDDLFVRRMRDARFRDDHDRLVILLLETRPCLMRRRLRPRSSVPAVASTVLGCSMTCLTISSRRSRLDLRVRAGARLSLSRSRKMAGTHAKRRLNSSSWVSRPGLKFRDRQSRIWRRSVLSCRHALRRTRPNCRSAALEASSALTRDRFGTPAISEHDASRRTTRPSPQDYPLPEPCGLRSFFVTDFVGKS